MPPFVCTDSRIGIDGVRLRSGSFQRTEQAPWALPLLSVPLPRRHSPTGSMELRTTSMLSSRRMHATGARVVDAIGRRVDLTDGLYNGRQRASRRPRCVRRRWIVRLLPAMPLPRSFCLMPCEQKSTMTTSRSKRPTRRAATGFPCRGSVRHLSVEALLKHTLHLGNARGPTDHHNHDNVALIGTTPRRQSREAHGTTEWSRLGSSKRVQGKEQEESMPSLTSRSQVAGGEEARVRISRSHCARRAPSTCAILLSKPTASCHSSQLQSPRFLWRSCVR